jgi:hypothetical protein
MAQIFAVIPKRSKWILVVCGLLVCAGGYRYLQIVPYPMGGGQFKVSPDERFTASADTMTENTFFGGTRDFYEFRLRRGDTLQGSVVRRIVISEPIEFGWREEGEIEWAADSSHVTFSFRGTRLTIDSPRE